MVGTQKSDNLHFNFALEKTLDDDQVDSAQFLLSGMQNMSNHGLGGIWPYWENFRKEK